MDKQKITVKDFFKFVLLDLDKINDFKNYDFSNDIEGIERFKKIILNEINTLIKYELINKSIDLKSILMEGGFKGFNNYSFEDFMDEFECLFEDYDGDGDDIIDIIKKIIGNDTLDIVDFFKTCQNKCISDLNNKIYNIYINTIDQTTIIDNDCIVVKFLYQKTIEKIKKKTDNDYITNKLKDIYKGYEIDDYLKDFYYIFGDDIGIIDEIINIK
jgi:hypothetical protein